jgi:hypothetical protein
MMSKSAFYLVGILSLLFCLPALALADETLTITTYYPSPYGVYRELRSNRMAIGDNYIQSGTYDWEASDGDGGEIDYNADLVVEGNVGIGTTTPSVKLEVGGAVRVGLLSDNNNSTVGEGSRLYFSGGGDWASYNSDNSDPIFAVRYNSASDKSQLRINVGDGSDSGDRIELGSTISGAWTPALIVEADSKVGIGTIVPLSKIGVLGNASIGATYGAIAAPTSGLIIEGNVGIGTTTPGTYALYINGTGYLNTTAWAYSSDRRLKENISQIQAGLPVIQQLKPVKFDYIKGEKKQAGFIAQEVEKVLPDIITKDKDGMLAMKTESIIPYLVKAVQEQQKEIEELKGQVKALKGVK